MLFRSRAECAQARTVESRAIRVEASRDSIERLALVVSGRAERWRRPIGALGSCGTLVGAPTSYLRQLPATLSGINLQHGLLSHRAELVKTLEAEAAALSFGAVHRPRLWPHLGSRALFAA